MSRSNRYRTHLINQRVKPDDVIAYYRLDGNADDFYNRVNGNADNVNYTTGIVGQAYDGSNNINSRILIPDNDLLSFTDGVSDLPFSFSIWLNFANTQTQYFFSKGVPDTVEYQFLYLSNNEFNIILNDLRNNSALDRILFRYPFTPSFNTWYHFAFTYDGSATVTGVKGYINSVAGGYATIDNYIGMVNNVGSAEISRSGSTHWDGQLDEFVIFNKELTQQEVTDIYNKGLVGEPLYT